MQSGPLNPNAPDTAPVALVWRAEIDGLRAVAVLSVVLYHLGVPGLPGGFVGVDIFFVISGYLITGILHHDLQAGCFSLGHFYRRRALRILPPLILMLAVTFGFSVLVMLPGEVRAVARAMVAALLSGSNLLFWASFDYFTPDARENPLLHTWSLGVEEQFYILVPVLLWAGFRYARRWLLPLFAASVALSFLVSVVTVGPMPKATFYLLPMRYWELGVGALLALSGWQAAGQLGGRLAQGLSGIGAALILYGVFGLSAASSFPGPNALWPVLGAVCLIAAGRQGVGAGLAMGLPVWVGRISYALYLWSAAICTNVP